MNIVLVHGVLGAKIFAGKPYFNGVADHFRQQHHDVMESDTKPIGTVALRAKELHDQIVRHFGAAPGEKLIIIAHSMGGLDARLMLHTFPELAKHVRSLTCIATPHRGSPVATGLNTLNVLSPFRRLVGLLSPQNPLSRLNRFIETFDAVDDLSVAGATKIDALCPDIDGIRYAEVVGLGRKEEDTAKFFQPLAKLVGGVNDGVVPRASALRPGRKPLEEVQADHADLVGHDVDDFPQFAGRKFDHLPLYDRILAAATAGTPFRPS
jgi:triacylglycerol lipase